MVGYCAWVKPMLFECVDVFSQIKRSPQNPFDIRKTMSESSSKPKVDAKTMRAEAWEKAEKALKKGQPNKALDLLREADPNGEHANTLRIAGSSVWELAKKSKSRAEYRQAAGLLRDAVKANSRDKSSGSAYNGLLNEMQDLGISEYRIPPLFSSGTPTPFGLMAILGVLVVSLGGLKVFTDNVNQDALTGDVLMEVSWTDRDGVDHSGKIWISLDDSNAPMHAESFRLNVNEGRYDGVIFHRIVDGFMIQGGDFENNDGTGGHAGKFFGYCKTGTGVEQTDTCADDPTKWVVPAEFGETHDPGVIAAARSSNENSAGSQFYLVDSTGAKSLDGQYSAFGMAYKGQIDGVETTGVDVIDAISQVECQTPDSNDGVCQDNTSSKSVHPVTIDSAILIDESGSSWWPF